jgi:CheY-like chemotaxis protein
MIEWLSNNRQWVFSGIGVMVLSVVFAVVRRMVQKNASTPSSDHETVQITNQNIVNVHHLATENERRCPATPSLCKASTHILFIDDDQKFRVVDILKKSGWTYTRRVSDVGSIDDPVILQAQILFVDIQGVGRKLQFCDEGLGLARAIKDKYPEKKVVIYSAETQGERFHDALRKADDFLAKNADPYEFQQLTERLALQIQNGS